MEPLKLFDKIACHNLRDFPIPRVPLINRIRSLHMESVRLVLQSRNSAMLRAQRSMFSSFILCNNESRASTAQNDQLRSCSRIRTDACIVRQTDLSICQMLVDSLVLA